MAPEELDAEREAVFGSWLVVAKENAPYLEEAPDYMYIVTVHTMAPAPPYNGFQQFQVFCSGTDMHWISTAIADQRTNGNEDPFTSREQCLGQIKDEHTELSCCPALQV